MKSRQPLVWRHPAAWVVLACACWAAGQAAWAAASTVRPDSFVAIETALQDDPRAAAALAERRLADAADPASRFWAHLAASRAHSALERHADGARSIEQARAALGQWPAATHADRLWLEQSALQVSWSSLEPLQVQEKAKALREQVQASSDTVLQCDFHALELTLLIDISSLDEAWLAAESLERCSRHLGDKYRAVAALQAMGTIAGRGSGRNQIDAYEHFARAVRLLADEPARLTRSVLYWEWGIALRAGRQLEAALEQFTQARRLSLAIGDEAGMAAADLAAAGALLQMERAAEALPLLREAKRVLQSGQDNGFRLFSAAELTVKALAMLNRAEVLQAIEQARQWDTATTPASERARLARTMASGYASQGRFAEAYREIERHDRLTAEARSFAADVQTLRLQARYAAARREAENAELRHREEASRLALAAETATQRALWATVATLVLLMAAGSAWARHALQRRRALADLALRDDLTGQPNRRAVRAYAQAQVHQAQRLGVPLALAVIDLDHFKLFNDTWGHSGGDSVLRAFATAATSVLRGQDRLGRWGGEEWLLVLPGTAVDEMPAVFERLRKKFAATTAEGVTGPHGCTFSMGAAQLNADAADLDALIAEADRQLYRAKNEGRDRLCTA